MTLDDLFAKIESEKSGRYQIKSNDSIVEIQLGNISDNKWRELVGGPIERVVVFYGSRRKVVEILFNEEGQLIESPIRNKTIEKFASHFGQLNQYLYGDAVVCWGKGRI